MSPSLDADEGIHGVYLGSHARSKPDEVAVTMWPSGRRLTFAQLHERSRRLAGVLRHHGLVPGDRVAVLSYNHLNWYVAAFAALNSGLYVVPVNAHSSADEAAHVVGDSGAVALLAAQSTRAVATAIVAHTPHVELRASLDGSFEGHPALDVLLDGSPPTAPLERRGAFFFYSSGTTGRPKGIRPPLPSTPARDGDPLLDAIGSLWHADSSSVYLSPAPLHHAAPLRTSTMMLEAGASVVCLERFDPEQALAAIAANGVTVSQWVPTMFIRMLRLPQETRERYDLSSHRRAIHAAAPCPVWVKEQMIAWWGPIIAEYYAGSENIGTTFLEADEWLRHRGSVGRATQGELHICDEAGAELGPGVDGLVYFDHPATSFEYHGDSEKTADLFHPSKPWRTLGDIGHVDDEGYLYLTDRATFMIISGGANIYPREIEDVLSEHPDVADVAVIGIPDDDLGERPLAIVQPVDPEAAPERICPGLLALCRDRLAAYKVPVRIELTSSLPRGEDGKLRKLVLRSRYPC